MKTLLAFIIVSALSLPTLPALAGPGATQIVTYKAAGMTGKTVQGYCWTSSNASMRSDAYRCMIGNSIMDPCFAVSAKVVHCPQNLVANTGTIIALTKPLPEGNPHAIAGPWTFQLAGGSGIMCNAGTGTVVGNYPFYCQGNLVCTAPFHMPQFALRFLAQCGTPTGPMSVKGVRQMYVATVWQ